MEKSSTSATMTAEREALLRAYATGDMTWSTLRDSGIDNYFDVLVGLGELGLRPPMAPMTGPNVETRMKGRELLRQILAEQGPR
jgi:hypothetical protein